MFNPFDVSTKQLIEADPLAWLHFFGLPGETAELIDANLDTIVADADRILSITTPDYLAHFEMQSTYKPNMGDRTLLYNAATHYKYRQTVESLVLLLRREADGPALSGQVAYGSLQFGYRVVRLWQRSPEELLNSSLVLLPLAPLTNVSEAELPGVVQRMEERIDTEAPAEERSFLWTTVWLLMGLKYTPELTRQLLKGVLEMKESSTYQYILEEGRVEGREVGKIEEARRMLLLMGGQRFGEPDAPVRAALDTLTRPEQFEELAVRLFAVESWQELLP